MLQLSLWLNAWNQRYLFDLNSALLTKNHQSHSVLFTVQSRLKRHVLTCINVQTYRQKKLSSQLWRWYHEKKPWDFTILVIKCYKTPMKRDTKQNAPQSVQHQESKVWLILHILECNEYLAAPSNHIIIQIWTPKYISLCILFQQGLWAQKPWYWRMLFLEDS